MDNRAVLSEIVEIVETKDIKEVAQKLSSGNWIAVCATTEKPYLFCLGRLKAQVGQ
jgi:hypothetical protein